MISDSIKNQVITLSAFGEIFLRVINHMICANLAHHVQIPGAAHTGDFSTERFGNLNSKSTNATRCPMDQNLLPLLNLSSVAKTLQSRECRYRDGCGRLKRKVGRL